MCDFDVAVAGAGPAGSATALMLAQQGLTVFLAEKATFPRPKLCGEGLMPAGVEILNSIGLLERARQIGRCFSGLTFHGNSGKIRLSFLEAGLSHAGLVLPRRDFDKLLAETARACDPVRLETAFEVDSVNFRQDSLKICSRSGRSVSARCLVGADGIHSKLHRILGIDRAPGSPKRLALQATCLLNKMSRHVEIFCSPGGEAYVAPLDDKTGRVTLLVNADQLLSGDPAEAFALMIEALPELRDWIQSPTNHLEVSSTSPISLTLDRCHATGCFLVGDAAGAVDAISGQGMTLALRDAALASYYVGRYLAARDDHQKLALLSNYTKRRMVYFTRSQELARMLMAFLHQPGSIRRASRTLSRSSALRRRLARIAIGKEYPTLTRWDQLRLAVGF